MIYIWGYFGGYNLGDELILLSWRRLLDEAGIPFVVVSKNPAFIRYVWGFNAVPPHIGLLSDGIHIIGGGGLFQNRTSCRSLFYYTLPALLKKAYIVGVGIGPLKREPSTWFMNSAFAKNSGRIWVRDVTSCRYLHRLGLFSRLAPDMAHLLQFPKQKHSDDRVLVVLGPKIGWREVTSRFLPKDAVVIAFHVAELSDLLILKNLGYTGYWGMNLLVSGRLFAIFSRFKRVWAGRLHGLILATMVGATIRMAPYDPKMIAYWKTWFGYDIPPVEGYANIGKAAAQLRRMALEEYGQLVTRLSVEGQRWV